MLTLLFHVNGQVITRLDKHDIIADSKNYLRAKFIFSSEEWTGVKTAIFTKGIDTRHQILDENDECEVPWEVTGGNFIVSVFCGDLIPSTSVIVSVKSSGYTDETAPKDPTPNVYNQLIATINNLKMQGVDEATIQSAVATYMSNNPIETLTEDNVKEILTQGNYASKDDIPSIDGLVSDRLNGKNIYCFGDSLMVSKDAGDTGNYDETYGWNGGYPKYIKDAHPLANVYNLGSSNGSMCPATATAFESMGQNAPYIPDVITDGLSGKTDVDYIIINGCGNDIYVNGMSGKSMTDLFGVVSDTIPTTADYSTLCGSLENIFHNLTTKFPAAKIIYISLPPIKQFYYVPTMWNEEIETTMNTLFETICRNYGVTFVNLCKTVLRRDLYLESSGFFYPSDVHLTDTGYKAVADEIDRAL